MDHLNSDTIIMLVGYLVIFSVSFLFLKVFLEAIKVIVILVTLSIGLLVFMYYVPESQVFFNEILRSIKETLGL